MDKLKARLAIRRMQLRAVLVGKIDRFDVFDDLVEFGIATYEEGYKAALKDYKVKK